MIKSQDGKFHSDLGSTEIRRSEDSQSQSARKGLAWSNVGLWMFLIELPLLLIPYISLLAQWFFTPVIATVSIVAIAKSLMGLGSEKHKLAIRGLQISIPLAAISVTFTIYAWNEGIGL